MIRFPSFSSDSDRKITSDGDSDDEEELQKCSAVPRGRPYTLDEYETTTNSICKIKNHSWINGIKM
jgi:hypothetical protein